MLLKGTATESMHVHVRYTLSYTQYVCTGGDVPYTVCMHSRGSGCPSEARLACTSMLVW